MFGLNENTQYYVCQRYVRMNMGINGLYQIVRTGVFALSGIMPAEYVLQNVRFFNLFIVYRIEPISRPAIRLKYRLPA